MNEVNCSFTGGDGKGCQNTGVKYGIINNKIVAFCWHHYDIFSKNEDFINSGYLGPKIKFINQRQYLKYRILK